MLLLACVGAVGLATASSALAAFTPTIAIRHQPASPSSNGPTSIRVAVPRDDDPLARAVIYVPTGYNVTLAQTAGTQIGTVSAQVQVREPIAGAVLPLTGTIAADTPANYTANACAPGLHAAVWVLMLQVSGETLTVPAYVDPTTGTEAALGTAKLTVCLPSPNIPEDVGGAKSGAKLILAQLNINQGIFRTPTTRGTFRWQLLATPWPATAGPPTAAGTVSAQGRVMLPARVNLRATSRNGRLTITGGVLEADTRVVRQTVRLRLGKRTFSVRTNAGGSFRLVLRRARGPVTITATASVPARSVTCSSPSPFPGVSCVSETLQFFVATRTLRHRVR